MLYSFPGIICDLLFYFALKIWLSKNLRYLLTYLVYANLSQLGRYLQLTRQLRKIIPANFVNFAYFSNIHSHGS